MSSDGFIRLVLGSRLTPEDKSKATSEEISAAIRLEDSGECELRRQRWKSRINRLEEKAHEIETMRQLTALNDGLKSEAPPSTSTAPPPAVAKAATGIAPKEKPLSPREKDNLHRIIAALLELAKTPRQNKNNDAGVIAEITEQHKGKDGLSARNLQAVFAQAKRILKYD